MNYGGAEALFASINAIRPDKRIAFKARLKHLQRLGFPPGVNTGTGRSANYGAGEIYQLGIALELLQLGLSPERAVRLVSGNIEVLKNAGRTALAELINQSKDYAMFLIFDPSGLAELSEQMAEDEASWTLTYGGPAKIRELLPIFIEEARRASIMNVSLLIDGVRDTLEAQHSREAADTFVADLEDWFGLYPVSAP